MNRIKTLFKKPVLFVAILILVFLLPSGISKPPEGIDLLHVVTIGIDKIDDELEVSVLAFVITSKKCYEENFLLLSSKAPSISEALKLISINVGKRLITLHTGVIIISQEFAEGDIVDTFNYFLRSGSITNDTFVMCTTSSAKEILMYEQSLVQSAGIRLEELSLFYENYISLSDINIESFYRGYFGPVKSSLFSLIGLVGENDAVQMSSSEEQSKSIIQKGSESGGGNGGSSSGDGGPIMISGGETGGGSESDSSGGADSGPKYLQSTGRAVVFYDGSFKTILNEEEFRGLNWIGINTKNVNLRIDKVSDENFEDAEMFFKVEGNEVKMNSYFNKKNKPVIEITIKLNLKVEQIIESDLNNKKHNIAGSKNYLTETVRDKIEIVVKKEFSKGLFKIIENQTDIIDVYKTLSSQNYAKFIKWYDSLDCPKDFLREIDYRVTVRTKASH